MPATAAHQEAAEGIQKILESNRDSLYSALDQPYFGRLDYFRPDLVVADGEVNDADPSMIRRASKTIYIGIAHIRDNDVFSWTAPVARLWYTPSYDGGYTAPRGYIPTKVDLKRYLKIRDRRLVELNDVFKRLRPAADQAARRVLTEALSGTGKGDGHLQVIVETIEPEQYESIANVTNKVLIVQGSAGSGKSEIGLHRIAFLLSPYSDIEEGERPTPETTLFVGPSQAFLDYAADILPTLDVSRGVQQTTFSEWIVSHLSVRLRTRARIWNDLLTKGIMTRFSKEAESFKTSINMTDVLVSHLRVKVRDIRNRCLSLPPLIVEGGRIRIDRNEIRTAISSFLRVSDGDYRLNIRRQDFVARITNLVWSKGEYSNRFRGYDALRQRRNIRDYIERQWLDTAWRHIDFRQEYVNILSDSDALLRLSKGTLTSETGDAMKSSVRNALSEGFEDSDVSALAYLDHLLNDTIQAQYRHIVVDEAQDISPVDFLLLGIGSVNNWFTILGDTSQRLTPYRGISRWRDLDRVLGRSEITVQHARTSYRSNKHITRFNNRILRLFDQNIPAPIAFDRDGYRPEYHAHSTTNAMYYAVIEEIVRIRSLDGLADATVAILVRDRSNLNRFMEICKQEQADDDITLVGHEYHSNARTIVARIPDTKGLEYDAVVVLGVNEAFKDTIFNRKLLYLATTRAKHYLGIHWSGRQSPILKNVYSGGTKLFDHRSAR